MRVKAILMEVIIQCYAIFYYAMPLACLLFYYYQHFIWTVDLLYVFTHFSYFF